MKIKAITPVKEPQSSRLSVTENTNPNDLSTSTPAKKPVKETSPSIKSAKSKNSAIKNTNQIATPRRKMQDRKFLVAKKKPKPKSVSTSVTCKCEDKGEEGKPQKCPCIAYQTLRASQEEFFKKRGDGEKDLGSDCSNKYQGEVEDGNGDKGSEGESDVFEFTSKEGISTIKRRDKLLEEVRTSVPDPGSGRVLHLIQAFEKLLSVPKSTDSEEEEVKEEVKKGELTLPGFQRPKVPETEGSLSFSPSEVILTPDSFGMHPRVSSSSDSNRTSLTSRTTSGGGRRSRRNSLESSVTFGGRKSKKKHHRVTNQQPFHLRTEQRGKSKEEEFVKKVQEKFIEEEKLRIPVAQGLPWTTDEPECLIKPPVKEITRPIDLKLHSDVRAEERAEFDQYVSEKLGLFEQYRLEKDRQQKLAEEEEIQRLRRELVPKAQPMPYFDRPFIPQRSMRNPTIPKQPKFHIPQHKKIKCMPWNDVSVYTQQNPVREDK
ncbi:hypothetical protein GIB67_000744 [Kingdonia uniflora]|uniref:TPX2 C-terminal domain-containing protein n=1 Tax=Kingdonia uniflora TaxID=39325 RepID=A0A7J7NDS3_9MAGN|nr:hypothetical protein GIB67_000744 [Kingdonia uniflora]